MYFKTPPFKHQSECFEIIKERPYHALFLEPGLGKTKIVLDVITYRKSIRNGYRVLVVCPNTIVENWSDEVKKHSDLSCTMLVGASDKRKKMIQQRLTDVTVINYESVRICLKELMEAGYNCVVFDESTEIKNPKAQQSKACWALSLQTKHRIIMSGTPIMNNPLDIFSQYYVLNNNIFGSNYYRFRARYAVLGGYLGKQVVKWVNMKELQERLYSCAIRKTKDECLDLPPKLYQVIRLQLPDEQKAFYNKLASELIAEYKGEIILAPHILTKLMRLSQITAGFTKTVKEEEIVFKTNPKIDWLMDFMENVGVSHKIVVFCRFKNEIAQMQQALLRMGYACVTVCGETEDRIGAVRAFNTDPSIRVFIGQLQTAGIGINLTSASYMVFMTNSYSYGDRVQCEDRIHRIGQQKNCTYIDLLCENTIDGAVYNALKHKKNLSDTVIDMKKLVKGDQ